MRTAVWVYGEPPYVLYYKQGRSDVPVELQSFRPDPARTLTPGRRYDAVVWFEEKPRGGFCLRSVTVDAKTFVRVR